MELMSNLIDVLKLQYSLYNDLLELMMKEKVYITQWNSAEIISISKKKNTIFFKEKVLNEARLKTIAQLDKEFPDKKLTIQSIIDIIKDIKLKNQFEDLNNKLINVAKQIQTENLLIKVLYSGNLKLISDFFENCGIAKGNTYTDNKKLYKSKYATFIKDA